MKIQENVSLSSYSTMRLGGNARYLSTASSDEGLQEQVKWAMTQKLPYRVIGGGSNIVWRDEGFEGLIIVNEIKGRSVLAQTDKDTTVMIGGGENWDEVVAWTVEQGLSGLEFLSLIPGTVGAAPVQNIGAYGAEFSDVIKEVGVYDTAEDCFESIPASECGFSYRTSRFKGKDSGRYLITHVVVTLSKNKPTPPFYESLQSKLDEMNVSDYSPVNIRTAVIAIRSAKLPDPKIVANNGSFFTNPIISAAHYEELMTQYPDIKGWPTKDGKVKLAAGWLVEKAGFKGVHDENTGMATWDKQALVLVNEHARSTKDLLEFRQKIMFRVEEMFGVNLEQEPELLP